MIFSKKAKAKQVTDRLLNVADEKKNSGRTERWFNREIFPLVPIYSTKKADEHNPSSFSFRWLIFNIWSLCSFDFQIAFVCDSHWGIGFIGMAPYIRWTACIPCPWSIQRWAQNHLWRRSKKSQQAIKNEQGFDIIDV